MTSSGDLVTASRTREANSSRTALATVRAHMRRRLLVSYRVDPEVAATLVPRPFRPLIVEGWAVAGVCVIGLDHIRPGVVRAAVGFASENVAHRIAVEWLDDEGWHDGVYIAARHSSSLLPVLAGGRLFPGVQRRARVSASDDHTRYRFSARAADLDLNLDAEIVDPSDWSSTLFRSPSLASDFHERGAIGWSPRRRGEVEPIELATPRWRAEPARVHSIASSFFDALPSGSAMLDSALVMRDLPFHWSRPASRPVAFPTTAAPGRAG